VTINNIISTKQNIIMKKIIPQFAIFIMAITLFNSCKKEFDSQHSWDLAPKSNFDLTHGHLLQTKTYSSEVVFKWMDMQLYLFRRNPTFIGGLPPERYYAYSAIALYESVVPGMPAYRTLSGQLTDMPAMPQTNHGLAYYWPACANAAFAAMTRSFLPNTTVANKASIDSLENALNKAYQMETDNTEFQRSVDFGKAVAQAVFSWSTSDGASNANAPYVPPVGPGLWVPTPPAFAPAFGPYWGNNRLMVPHSLDGTEPQAPPVYSEDPSSDYYKMVKQVYDISQTLTPAQIATALYYRDNPGFGGGHYLFLIKEVLEKENKNLDFSAYVFAKTCIAIIDGGIGCWQMKFKYNQQRPISYIRGVLGYTTWNPLFATPNFPDFPSGHSTLAGVFAQIMEGFFGDHYHFIDHTYDYLGMSPRSFSSFNDFTQEVSDARVFAGIHNYISCNRAILIGRKIAENVNDRVKFLKE
jgi:hypothetical protein